MKEQNIMAEDWDNLIILDACRYDFFEKAYEDYLPNGKLEKRRSKGSDTLEWLKNNFTAKYDITYISSNPYVNSHGIPLNKLKTRWRYPWKATEHFSKIIDVWHFAWDESLGTVHPEEVNKACLSIKGRDENRKIIHYAQPHTPYLSCAHRVPYSTHDTILRKEKTISGGKVKSSSRIERVFHRFRVLIAPIVLVVIKPRNVWRLKDKLGMKPSSSFEAAWRKGGMEEIKYYYEDNLRRVLESVSRLINELDGKIVITADHGEAFGESGIIGHRSETHIPALVEVPWLVIDKAKKSTTAQRKAERERVRAKARKLKQSGRLYKFPQNTLYERQVYSCPFPRCQKQGYVFPVKAPGQQDCQAINGTVRDKQHREHPSNNRNKAGEDKVEKKYQSQRTQRWLQQVPVERLNFLHRVQPAAIHETAATCNISSLRLLATRKRRLERLEIHPHPLTSC